MLHVPSTPPVLWLMGLFSAFLLGGGTWLVWEWYDNWAAHLPANPRYLIQGALLLALSLLGGPLVTLLLGRKPCPGEVPMKALIGGAVHQAKCPDGTRLHFESFGPEHAPVLLFTHGWGLSSAEWFCAASDVLPTTGVPTLVIAASSDWPTLPDASAYLTRHIPEAENVMLSPAGHMGLIEHHETWAAAVDSFAARCFTDSG